MNNKEKLTQHISQQFNQDLEAVRSNFLAMGGLVEQQVLDAMKALVDVNVELAEAVIKNDSRINRMEIEVDEELMRIMALRHPAASDLRLVVAIGKSVTDLERIGDEAFKIARATVALYKEGESPRGYAEARSISARVSEMLHDVLDAFARFDAKAAFEVMKADSYIDREYEAAMRSLITYMMEDPRSISRILNVMNVLRSLERVGDHARNIAEQLIYMVQGIEARHTDYDEIERRLSQI
ncbi:phosphate signaling complex protein PhoU [Amnimonas aquatica]|uniref:Phosphate-specific transport system accessory protein PhoU n=1 Tax=Amnimonas aquatica TaxID=2094561 RepID=A0A2P6AU80_9GAMM|nr:phosphate signaling complex protein PhoU [Amnimonas aquatica]PQA49421.1 phosphate transport system regulatory protein PhoU [Amnimonas aquatica]